MQIIKRTLLATSVTLAMLTSMSSVFADGEQPKAETKKVEDSVIATVNGTKIMKSTLDGYLNILKKSGKADVNAAVDDLVSTEIALQEATKTDILDRPKIKKALSDYKRNVLLKVWTKEKVDSFDISDDEIKKAYDERVTKLASKEYNARHILVKTEDEAKAIIKQLKDGADFAKLAKEKSTGPSGANGGSLGWFKAQTMVPAFANAVKEMKKGEFSKEPVKTQFGYHVIKLEDSRDAKLPPLEALKPQLKRVIAQKKMIDFMKGLKEKADVKITLPKEDMTEKKADAAGKTTDTNKAKTE